MEAVSSTEMSSVVLDLGNTAECVKFTKGDETNLLVLSHEIVVLTSLNDEVNREPFIKIAKLCKDYDEAKQEFYHILGKMCLKDSSSKYFNSPNKEEHLKNGSFPAWSRDFIVDVARTAVVAARKIA